MELLKHFVGHWIAETVDEQLGIEDDDLRATRVTGRGPATWSWISDMARVPCSTSSR